MNKMVITGIILFILTSTLHASQVVNTEAEGTACMGDDKSRKDTELLAHKEASRRAAENAATYVRSETHVKDSALEKDLVSAYANSKIRVVKELEKGWFNDPQLGDCYRVKITAEVLPDEKLLATHSAIKVAGKDLLITASGLKYFDVALGKGASPMNGSRVTVHYTGTLENGKKFDSSLDRKEPFTFVIGVSQVIRGWDEGIMSMKVGGKRKLIIPPPLAYGAKGAGKVIPPNATLHFDVELLDVQ